MNTLTFGGMLRLLRTRAERSMGDLADHLRVSVPFISDVERDIAPSLNAEQIMKTAEFLGLPGQKGVAVLLAMATVEPAVEYKKAEEPPPKPRGPVTAEDLVDVNEVIDLLEKHLKESQKEWGTTTSTKLHRRFNKLIEKLNSRRDANEQAQKKEAAHDQSKRPRSRNKGRPAPAKAGGRRRR